jgi:hypothetical protein
MAPELHLRPDRLRTHAATAAGLADELHAAGGRPAAEQPEVDRLRTAVLRAAGELAELSAVLATAATAAERSDEAAAGSLGRLLRVP